jgi:hypothetical protein
MTQCNLEVIPEPAQGTAAVFIPRAEGPIPLLRGQGSHDFLCGAFDNVITKDIDCGQMVNIVLNCPNCGSFNRAMGT